MDRICTTCGLYGECRKWRTKCRQCESKASLKNQEGKPKKVLTVTERASANVQRRSYYRKDPKKWSSVARKWQLENPEKLRKSQRSLTKEKKRLIGIAKNVPCADCNGRFELVCMDFDHVRGSKTNDVSRMVYRSFSIETLMSEMEKCEVVCANCHRIRTSKRSKKNV